MELNELLAAMGLSDRPGGQIDGIARAGRNGSFGCLVCVCGEVAEDEAMAAYERGARVFLSDRFLPLPSDGTVMVSQRFTEDYSALCAAFYGNPEKELTLIGVCGGREAIPAAGLITRMLDRLGAPCALLLEDGYQMGERRIVYTEHPIGPKEFFHALRDAAAHGYRAAVVHLSSYALEGGFGRFVNYGVRIDPPDGATLWGDGATVCHPERRRLFSGGLLRTYGAGGDVDVNVISREFGKTVCALSNGRPFSVPLLQEDAGRILAAALAACMSAGATLRRAVEEAEVATTVAAMEVIPSNDGVLYVLDASFLPEETASVLKAVRERVAGRVIGVLGCVGMRDHDRRAPIGRALDRYADTILLTADNPGFEAVERMAEGILAEVVDREKFSVISDRSEAIRQAVSLARPEDAVLFLGKGYEPYQLIGSRRVPYSERDIILAAIQNKKA